MIYDVKPIVSPKKYDCAPTCLQMLLDYYGVSEELDILTKKCNVGLAGCTAADVNRVGREYGLDMRAYKMDAEELIRQDRPGIIWWNFFHFCIFCGLDDDGKVVICNPDRGKYRHSVDSFKSFYSGIAIFNGDPQDLPEEPADQVTLTQSEYDDIMDVVAKAEEVFASETGE